MQKNENIYLSIITVPYNDGDDFHQYLDEVLVELKKIGKPFEIICLDSDTAKNSSKIVSQYSKKHPEIKGYLLSHPGVSVVDKTNKYMLGFNLAQGKYIITMDSDRQDRAEEINKFIEKLEEGYHFVNGYKQKRQDSKFYMLTSKLANWTMRTLTGVKVHDMNNGFKGFQSHIAKSLNLKAGYFRFIPIILHGKNFRMTEVPVKHMPRAYGEKKFNFLSRLQGGVFDMFSIILTKKLGDTPMYLIGWLSVATFLLGFVAILLDLLLVHSLRIFIVGTAFIFFTFILFSIGLLLENMRLNQPIRDYSKIIAKKID